MEHLGIKSSQVYNYKQTVYNVSNLYLLSVLLQRSPMMNVHAPLQKRSALMKILLCENCSALVAALLRSQLSTHMLLSAGKNIPPHMGPGTKQVVLNQSESVKGFERAQSLRPLLFPSPDVHCCYYLQPGSPASPGIWTTLITFRIRAVRQV